MNKTRPSRDVRDRLRLWPWLVGALVAGLLASAFPQHPVAPFAWALAQLCAGAWLGYWIDRNIFCYARPGRARFRDSSPEARHIVCLWMLRRAAIVAAAIIALALAGV